MPPIYSRKRRDDRFIDPEDAFQKFPKDAFSTTLHYKHVRNLISIKFSMVQQKLQEELRSNTLFSITWKNAEARYFALKGVLSKKNQGLSRLPDECHIAIIAYTMELNVGTFNLYADFNKKCRELTTESSWNKFSYKSFFALLARAIHGICNNHNVDSEIYFRGVHHKILYLKEGDYVFPSQFLSCSTAKEVAVQFMGSHHGTLITFRGSPLAACGIVEYSDFPDEEEMLVFPWSTFKVTKIKQGIDCDEVFLESVGPLVHDLPLSGKYINKGIRVNNP